jgi:hypothetical protein
MQYKNQKSEDTQTYLKNQADNATIILVAMWWTLLIYLGIYIPIKFLVYIFF